MLLYINAEGIATASSTWSKLQKRPRNVRYPPANAVLAVNVKIIVFFHNKYVHARKAANETNTGEKKLYQIPGTYPSSCTIGAVWQIRSAVHPRCGTRRKRALKEWGAHTQADTVGQRKDARYERDKHRPSYIRVTYGRKVAGTRRKNEKRQTQAKKSQ